MMPKTPYSLQRSARQQNAAAVLHDLWRHAPLSKAMLAQRNGLTKATVSAICHDLTALDLIRDMGQDRSRLGRPGNLLILNASARCAIGVELSTNYVAAILSDLCGDSLWHGTTAIQVGSDQETVLLRAEALIAEAAERASACGIPLLGIGVGVPGTVAPGPHSLVSAPALGWKEVPLKQIWEERFAWPVMLENRARTAAMAEALNGSAQDVNSFVYVSLGTDVQSSIEAAVITGGALFRGVRGLGADAGHMILDPQGALCTCGQRGCWQAVTDVVREVELASARLAAGEASTLRCTTATDRTTPDHRMIHQAALEGDALALDVLRTVQMNHALGISNLVRLFDPELVVIGWASAVLSPAYHARMRALSDLLDIPAAVCQQLAHRGVAPPPIAYAVHGPEAPMLGAAALLVADFLQTPPTGEA